MIITHALYNWIQTLDPDAEVWIDEGGLTLCGPEGAYLEVGGNPDEDEPPLVCDECGEPQPEGFGIGTNHLSSCSLFGEG